VTGNARAATVAPAIAETNGKAPEPARSLYGRLSAVQHGLGRIPPTGKNPFGGEALSIGDVEAAIRPLLVEHGVLTLWSYVSLTQLEKGMWMAHLKVRLQNADDETDCHDDEWIDVGNNPMAATSFARKGYWKALFHIAEPGDDKLPDAKGGRATAGQAHSSSSGGSPAPSTSANGGKLKITEALPLKGHGCTACGEGELQLKTLSDGRRFIGCDRWPDCRFTAAATPELIADAEAIPF
jgi:Topoisomerase DNA binding C4 zinc finger